MVKFASLLITALVGVASAAPMPGSSGSPPSSNSTSNSTSSSSSSNSTSTSSAMNSSSTIVSSSSGYGSSSSSSGYGSSSYGSSGSNSGYGSSSYGSSGYGSSNSGSSSYGSSSYGSSGYGSSSYGSSSDSMGYGSSGSSYDGSSSYGSSGYGSSSSSSSYSPPMYGSGSSMSSSSYDSCVQQCVAEYGMPSSMSMPSSTYGSSSSSYEGSQGTGSTITVIVAPSKGVLRYVPFAVNASVGDTIKFVWMAGPHTVTKSSMLEICNKTADQPFASGQQNASFVFTQRVNDTNTTFYYCGVPTHCEKGMFGMINPPSALVQPSSIENSMAVIAANSPATAAAWSSMSNLTGPASSWGGSIDLSGMPDWQQTAMVDNVIYTRSFLAANPSVIDASGAVDLSSLQNGNYMVPPDIVAAATAANSSTTASDGYGSGSASASSSGSATAAANAAAQSTSAAKSGAGALASPRSAVALVAVAAAFFAL